MGNIRNTFSSINCFVVGETNIFCRVIDIKMILYLIFFFFIPNIFLYQIFLKQQERNHLWLILFLGMRHTRELLLGLSNCFCFCLTATCVVTRIANI